MVSVQSITVTENLRTGFDMRFDDPEEVVYYSQLTTVNNEQLNEQAANLLEFDKYGLIFNYDLLGYGVMALSTFFTGLSMKPKNKTDKWLRALLMIHGVFYFSCTFMPITGMFVNMSSGGDGIGGRLALVAWCVYFLPIGILSFLHFHSRNSSLPSSEQLV